MSFRPAAVLHPAAAFAFLLAGLVLRFSAGLPDEAHLLWTVGLYATGLPLVFRTVRGIFRGRFAADLVAALAIVGAVLLAQPLAGLVVTLMQTGGEALEHFAERRATRAVRELEAQAPRIAHRLEGDQVSDIEAEAVRVGDLLLVRPGEMVPCDAVVTEGSAAVDISRVTGEPVPLHGQPGVALPSGSLVLDGPLTVRAHALASESLYARVVELVRTAQASKAPLQRLADRVAVWFTPLTLAVCGAAWGFSGDPVRVLAVLVVATPCPLILATPVAIIGGINRAARRQIIVRHGGALEALAAADSVVFDKTGTLTLGQPEVEAIEPVEPWTTTDLLRLAAGVEQGAGHPLARSLVRAAGEAGVALPRALSVQESPGRGVTGLVDGHHVTVGALSLVRERAPGAAGELDHLRHGRSGLHAYVAVDGAAGGVFTFADHPRPGLAEVFAELRRLRIGRMVLLSGDHADTARAVAAAVGLSEAAGDLLPGEKVAYVQRMRREGRRVIMVGDGINDAPALSAATVGVALAEHGGGIAAEAADVVLLENDVARVSQAVRIGQDTMRIARQSLGAGLGLSFAAMVVAAFGYIPPTAGAVLQEGIDLAVILNALRAA
ncbi:MAG TPA: heavy metal translocating P-type ATPase, partial [Gemmatimonadales bacterium]|nr:heavy metal translocating P-type ATPase [Gemmatimonadales bacterium]